jgi:hypothetical protein
MGLMIRLDSLFESMVTVSSMHVSQIQATIPVILSKKTAIYKHNHSSHEL